MRNNKILVYIGILALGVLLGSLLFGSLSEEENIHHHDKEVKTDQMWTCSMHPQIIQPKPGDCPICGMDLIPAEVEEEGLSSDQFKLTENAMALANIQTSMVGSSAIDGNAVKLSGKIVENEEANAIQVSYFSGRIERLYVSFTGEEVRNGQLLATIYSPELFAAQQELITASSLKESQPNLYKAVRNKLKLWKLSESQINQIETSGKVRENFPVYATVSGTVSEKLVEEGASVQQGQPLLKITNLATVWGNFDVYEQQIDLVKKGQEIVIATNAHPNQKFKGKVAFIDPVMNTRTRIVTLRVVLNNQNDELKPGMFVEGTIKGVNVREEAVLRIPSSAILWTGKRSVVYVKVNSDTPVFEMKEVILGNKIGDSYEILEGLTAGDEIVTNGTFTVDAAAQLQGKRSMMNTKKEKHQSKSGSREKIQETQAMAMTNINFGVRGNCEMCKNTIEKAANSVEGVVSANWSVDHKKIEVSFDDTKTNEMNIHKAIAASGYDTEKLAGDTEAYKSLPSCCQYSRNMKMNQSEEEKAENHSVHHH